MDNKTLSALFNKFAGREVPLTVTPQSRQIGGQTYNYDIIDLADKNDPTIAEIQKTAEDNGLRLRLWLPGAMGTMDVQPNRLNVHVDKEADGKYRVQKNFGLG